MENVNLKNNEREMDIFSFDPIKISEIIKEHFCVDISNLKENISPIIKKVNERRDCELEVKEGLLLEGIGIINKKDVDELVSMVEKLIELHEDFPLSGTMDVLIESDLEYVLETLMEFSTVYISVLSHDIVYKGDKTCKKCMRIFDIISEENIKIADRASEIIDIKIKQEKLFGKLFGRYRKLDIKDLQNSRKVAIEISTLSESIMKLMDKINEDIFYLIAELHNELDGYNKVI